MHGWLASWRSLFQPFSLSRLAQIKLNRWAGGRALWPQLSSFFPAPHHAAATAAVPLTFHTSKRPLHLITACSHIYVHVTPLISSPGAPLLFACFHSISFPDAPTIAFFQFTPPPEAVVYARCFKRSHCAIFASIPQGSFHSPQAFSYLTRHFICHNIHFLHSIQGAPCVCVYHILSHRFPQYRLPSFACPPSRRVHAPTSELSARGPNRLLACLHIQSIRLTARRQALPMDAFQPSAPLPIHMLGRETRPSLLNSYTTNGLSYIKRPIIP